MGILLYFITTTVAYSANTWANDPTEINGQNLLKKYCSQCHGPPSAKSRQNDHWRTIILRMQNHRQKRGYKLLSESEIRALTHYLNQNNMDNSSE